MNGEWLDNVRGGPVRVVVPEGYGFKCVKWVSHILLTNLFHANDTYADGNNDVESWLKTFAATLSIPHTAEPGEAIPVTGYAQVGLQGLSKVQVSLRSDAADISADQWIDAQILPPPKNWGHLPEGKIPKDTIGFDSAGQPRSWPMRLAKVHWAAAGVPAGDYTFRCRTIDQKGIAQPMPRPFKNSGHSAIESVDLKVKG